MHRNSTLYYYLLQHYQRNKNELGKRKRKRTLAQELEFKYLPSSILCKSRFLREIVKIQHLPTHITVSIEQRYRNQQVETRKLSMHCHIIIQIVIEYVFKINTHKKPASSRDPATLFTQLLHHTML